MALELKKATRKQVKLRIGISGASGFGKTASALIMAHGLVNDWDKIAVIDTENESASLYSNHTFTNGYTIGEFQTVSLRPPFTPEKYIEAIHLCEEAGIEVIVLDSITHVWKGQGGLLEYQNSLGGKYQDWAKTTPLYQKWLDTILQSKCHVITTVRRKQAFSMTQENGRTKVEKAGMEEEIRDGYEYELTVNFEITNDKHLARASKDRTSLFMGKPETIISEETGEILKKWAESGVDEVADALKEVAAAKTSDEVVAIWNRYSHLRNNTQFATTAKERGTLLKNNNEKA